MEETKGVLCWAKDEVGRVCFGVELALGSFWPRFDEQDGFERIVRCIRNQVYMDKELNGRTCDEPPIY